MPTFFLLGDQSSFADRDDVLFIIHLVAVISEKVKKQFP
jgi:hypothetical protein